MEPVPVVVVAADHPSLQRALGSFFDELRGERACRGRGSATERTPLIERLNAPRAMRLAATSGTRVVAVASVDNDGAVALAVAEDVRRRGIGKALLEVLTERAAAVGYPPLHRDTTSGVRLAG